MLDARSFLGRVDAPVRFIKIYTHAYVVGEQGIAHAFLYSKQTERVEVHPISSSISIVSPVWAE
jgi:hypothetical protein